MFILKFNEWLIINFGILSIIYGFSLYHKEVATGDFASSNSPTMIIKRKCRIVRND